MPQRLLHRASLVLLVVVLLNRWRGTSLRPGQPGMPQRLLHRASLVRRKLEERPQKGSDLARVGRRHVVFLSEDALQIPETQLVDVFQVTSSREEPTSPRGRGEFFRVSS